MIYDIFHDGERNHSLLGFGMMRLPKTPDGEIDEATAFQMVEQAYRAGITYFDTAYPYHNQKSENFTGRALSRYPRESFELADKMPVVYCETIDDYDRIFQLQLERCGVDYFDNYLFHALNASRFEKIKELHSIDWLRQKKKEGKIRRMGFSFHDTPDVLREIIRANDWDFVQLQLNYADWVLGDAKELYDIATEAGLPIIVMEPVRGGFLASPPPAVAEVLRQANPDVSMASWALRFVASLPNVKLVLSGMSAPDQMSDNLKTFTDETVYLSEQDAKVVEKAADTLKNIKSIPCTGCRYCMPCPQGVAIPDIFALYNKVMIFNKGEAEYEKNFTARDCDASRCVKCGACTVQCPQNLAIFDLLETAHQRLTTPAK